MNHTSILITPNPLIKTGPIQNPARHEDSIFPVKTGSSSKIVPSASSSFPRSVNSRPNDTAVVIGKQRLPVNPVYQNSF